MKLPRDLTGTTLAALLQRHYGYAVSRQRGSHLTVTVTSGDSEYSVTIPRHRQLRVGRSAPSLRWSPGTKA